MNIKKKFRKGFVLFLGIPFLALGLVNCGDDDDDDPLKTFVRVIHLSPDAPGVDVFVNQTTQAVDNLAFEEGTGFLELDEGTYDFSVSATGTPASASVLDIDDLQLEGNKFYTAVAFDKLSSIKALALEENFSGLGSGDIRIRAIHTASAVGQVDIWAIFDSADPVLLYENVDFGVAGEYLDLAAAAYTIGFDVNDDAKPDVVFDLPALEAGTVANVFAVSDDVGAVFLLAQLRDGTVAKIDPVP